MHATRSRFADDRWHFQHGPIDLIIGVDGEAAAVARALGNAWRRFGEILPELVSELRALRQPIIADVEFGGRVAQRMFNACCPHRGSFITSMAAVAGAVADELMPYFSAERGIARAYINNGGDIALHLQAGQHYRIGLFADLGKFAGTVSAMDGDFDIDADMPVRGVATSGWHGRSFSLGIADSVTVLAANAATADAAATMIANAVNSDHPAIVRAPASSLKDDTDLGDLPVTVEVGRLPAEAVQAALRQGVWHAACLVECNTIYGAVLVLQGQTQVVGMHQSAPLRLHAA
ncbi:MAG TPA: hypothetical protein DIT28_00845 [Oxalobacteraceae bacterium]|nr:hypothetical protein [Oxalobacteraceae bacterium]